jgi:hypothetical protein
MARRPAPSAMVCWLLSIPAIGQVNGDADRPEDVLGIAKVHKTAHSFPDGRPLMEGFNAADCQVPSNLAGFPRPPWHRYRRLEPG